VSAASIKTRGSFSLCKKTRHITVTWQRGGSHLWSPHRTAQRTQALRERSLPATLLAGQKPSTECPSKGRRPPGHGPDCNTPWLPRWPHTPSRSLAGSGSARPSWLGTRPCTRPLLAGPGGGDRTGHTSESWMRSGPSIGANPGSCPFLVKYLTTFYN